MVTPELAAAGNRARAASLPPWSLCRSATRGALRRVTQNNRSLGPRLLWVILALLLLWCIGTTLLLLRLALHVDRVEHSVEQLEESAAVEDGVQVLLDKWRAGGLAVRRTLARVPLVSAAYIVVAPHLGWIYALVAPHVGPLRFAGSRLLWVVGQVKPLLKMVPPLLQRVKPLLVMIDLRAKVRMLLAEWGDKSAAAMEVARQGAR